VLVHIATKVHLTARLALVVHIATPWGPLVARTAQRANTAKTGEHQAVHPARREHTATVDPFGAHPVQRVHTQVALELRVVHPVLEVHTAAAREPQAARAAGRVNTAEVEPFPALLALRVNTALPEP
jgi:hypothetical protein